MRDLHPLRMIRASAAEEVLEIAGEYPRKRVAWDDVPDAFVAALTASQELESMGALPKSPGRDRYGLPMEMVYAESIPEKGVMQRLESEDHHPHRRERAEEPKMGVTREQFASLVDQDLIEGVRALARTEGRKVESLVDEAFADLLQKHQRSRALACADRLPGEPRTVRHPLRETREVTDYLTVSEVLAIHEDQIDRYGGARGVRTWGNSNVPSSGHRQATTRTWSPKLQRSGRACLSRAERNQTKGRSKTLPPRPSG